MGTVIGPAHLVDGAKKWPGELPTQTSNGESRRKSSALLRMATYLMPASVEGVTFSEIHGSVLRALRAALVESPSIAYVAVRALVRSLKSAWTASPGNFTIELSGGVGVGGGGNGGSGGKGRGGNGGNEGDNDSGGIVVLA